MVSVQSETTEQSRAAEEVGKEGARNNSASSPAHPAGPPRVTWKKAWGHFRTVTHHRHLVRKGCWAVGLYWQGLVHDLSKYSPTEFRVGATYYQGTRSPNNAEREAVGYSSAWLHHKGRNRHHYEYWLDYSSRASGGINGSGIVPCRMPLRYVVEMLMDRIAACKTYHGDAYKDSDAWDYYAGGDTRRFLHPDTADLLERLLHMLAEEGEEKTFAYVRLLLKRGDY